MSKLYSILDVAGEEESRTEQRDQECGVQGGEGGSHVESRPATMSHPLGWLIFKKQKIASVGEDVEKFEPLCVDGGKVQ